MRAFGLLVCGCVFVSAGTAESLAQSVTIGATKDSTLYQETNGELSNGAGSYMFAGRTGQQEDSIRRALLAFDVAAAVPAGSVITGATLRLRMSKTNSGATTQSLHRVLANWGQGPSNDSANEGNGTGSQAGDSTWIHTFYNSSFWSTPGGDFAALSSGATSVDGIGFYTWSGAGLVGDVQSWLNSPGANFGWLLHGDESGNFTSKRYDTRENSTSANRPQLTITYVVPAPGALGAILLGGALAATRRRRSA